MCRQRRSVAIRYSGLNSVRGEARVICFSPRHDLTLAEMSIPAEIRIVIDFWAEQTAELGARFSLGSGL